MLLPLILRPRKFPFAVRQFVVPKYLLCATFAVLILAQCDAKPAITGPNLISELHLGLPEDSAVLITSQAGWHGTPISSSPGSSALIFPVVQFPNVQDPLSATLSFHAKHLASLTIIESSALMAKPMSGVKFDSTGYETMVRMLVETFGKPARSGPSLGDLSDTPSECSWLTPSSTYIVRFDHLNGISLIAWSR